MAYVRMVADNSLTSKVIRWELKDMFSHVGFKLDDEQWLDCRLDGGVQIRPANSVDDTVHIDFTFPNIEQAIVYGKTLIGTKYDIVNILQFVDPSFSVDSHKLICSRFVRECAEYVKCPLLNPTVPDYHIAPAHFVFPIGVVSGVTELDRWPKDLQL